MALAVRGASGIVTTLPPFRVYQQSPVATLRTQRLNIGAYSFRDPQPVQG